MAYQNPAYRGDAVKNTRVDRPDEGLDTEQLGVGGTGLARNRFDDETGGNPRSKGASTTVDTTNIGLTTDASLKRAISTS